MYRSSRRTLLKYAAALSIGGAPAPAAGTETVVPEEGNFAGKPWPSEAPTGCPFTPSQAFSGLRFRGQYARYGKADTWYPSWASDGNLYSPWTDGEVGGVKSNSFGERATTGQAKIVGDDPLHLQITNIRTYRGDPDPYEGRYPCGSMVHNGVWYYGTYCLMDSDGNPGKGLNWDILGPFVGFRWSTDFGATWQDTPHTPSAPLFGEPEDPGKTVRFGAPHFVDFGRNMQHSPDGKAYLVGHGSQEPDPAPRRANASWITGDQIYLARVTPSVRNINDASKYEFFAGRDASGHAVWTADFQRIRPLLDWNNHCGCVTATYMPGLKKYLMCVTDGGNTISKFSTYLLEADLLTGPWRLVTYMKDFGEQGYFVNIPSKFVTANGRGLWLCYAANFANGYLKTNYRADPPGSGYGMTLQAAELVAR